MVFNQGPEKFYLLVFINKVKFSALKLLISLFFKREMKMIHSLGERGWAGSVIDGPWEWGLRAAT